MCKKSWCLSVFVLVSLYSCNQCGRASPLPSRFYELELNIQGHKNLTECITEFLKVPLVQLHRTHKPFMLCCMPVLRRGGGDHSAPVHGDGC